MLFTFPRWIRFIGLGIAIVLLAASAWLLATGLGPGSFSQAASPAVGSATAIGELSIVRKAATGPLRVSAANPRYFQDANGRIVYLTGSHTWSNLQDNGGIPFPLFNYADYLNFLTLNNHNFFRLWVWEQARWTVETSDSNYHFDPMPYLRTGPGTALDGGLKFDLSKFNQAYFDRMRTRIIQAGNRGIYVSIMLFDGWSIESAKGQYAENNPWRGHPFNRNNNINSINGDPNNNNSGEEVHTLDVPAVTLLQKEYIEKVIDTVNDLDNVLYEIANESHNNSELWQYAMIQHIRQYEAGKPKQHPIGMTVTWPGGWNPDLFASDADWISPNNSGDDYLTNPPAANGSKVILADTDHLCGVCADRSWVWKSFTRGENVIYMDVYDGAGYGVGADGFDANDPMFVSARRNMGYTLSYANRMNLAATRPLPGRCSTGYCLANLSTQRPEFLVYAPNGGTITVDLSGVTAELFIEWLNPATGATYSGGKVTGSNRFTPPFSGDAVLFLHPQVIETKTYVPFVPRGR